MKMMNKKAISAVVGVVIMVALVIGLTAIVWTTVTNVVKDELGGTKSCLDYDKVTLNNRYTCLNASSDELYFSVRVADINVTELVVSISGSGDVQSFKINGLDGYAYVKNNADTAYNKTPLILPGANSGKTYGFNFSHVGMTGVDAIEIAPVIDGDQCDKSDSIQRIDDCRVFVN